MEEQIIEKENLIINEGQEIAVDENPISNEIVRKPARKKSLKGVVIKGFLNVRKDPSITSEIVKVLADASKVIILSEDNDEFYKVNAEGVIGYCMKKFVKKVK